LNYLFDIPYGILFGCNCVGFFALGGWTVAAKSALFRSKKYP
jgi:hypothetical protein